MARSRGKYTKAIGLTNTTGATRPKMRFKQSGNDMVDIQAKFPKLDIINSATGTSPVYSIFVDPTAFNSAVVGIAKQYQEYVVTTNNLHYVPNVGTTTGGKVWAAYFDSAEIMHRAFNSSLPNPAGLVKNCSTVECWPVWSEHTLVAPRNTRKKQFQIDNSNYTSYAVSDFDRAVQGVWLMYTEGNVTVNQNFGVINMTVKTHLVGLQDSSFSGI